ncbi:flagellar biosynthetic protein FliQ (plasmid) [Paroceanicella profunda]|uniref:Flagellar biosynthetic protein FliQ n=1 Tax=Paroceanicella profunda TaxID=2579971 RepID=A0A5B8G449_9RHOB|nr:flagellar biosynthetic protein FliQ [Paroceanicella profunda]QDL94780.1 flagellar biosynthetic protein FliQ [Paroceanicella profunda]
MSDTQIYDLLRDALWVGFLVCLPVLGVALAIGLLIGLFQALTSVQEMTLTFVPKLAAMMAVYWVTMGFMSGILVDFFHDRVLPAIVGS